MWKTVQSKGGIARLVQLVIDMKVWWSSTYLMLHRTEGKKTVRAWQIFYHLYSFFYSLSTPLLMNYTGMRQILPSATRYTSSNWLGTCWHVSRSPSDIYIIQSCSNLGKTNFISMPTMHNKLFHPTKHQLFTWRYLLLKLFIGHGCLVLNVQSMSNLKCAEEVVSKIMS